MNLTVTGAKRDERILVERLLQLCLHDYTVYDPFPIGRDGLFKYPWGDEYWTSSLREVFLFRTGAELAGFALVRRKGEGEALDCDWQLAEFFVLGAHRRRGIGSAAAIEIIRDKPGVWEIGYVVKNLPARAFWKQIVLKFDATAKPRAVERTRERYLFRLEEASSNQSLLRMHSARR